ncbi:MAG TPA: dihydrofolate reductase family protein [Roseateles sp.]
MSRLILQMQMSADGRMSADADIDWLLWNWAGPCPWDERLKRDFNAVFDGIGTILLSRPMAEEGYIDHWGRVARAHAKDPHYAFAHKIVQARKVVLSDKLAASRWDRTVLARRGLTDEVSSLKDRGGGDIICFGGVGFASALVAAHLVDEFQLFINPVAVGAGRSIFGARPGGVPLRLLQSTAYDCGMVVCRYAPAATAALSP